MKYFNNYFSLLISCMIALSSCTDKGGHPADEAAEIITPVTVTTIIKEPLTEYIELNATSTFLQKSYVKATANGYLLPVTVQLGANVNTGQLLFSLKTKESQIVGNTINVLDSTLKFSGVIAIKASDSGYLTQINHQTGDYVQDGEQLAVVSNINSFVFLLDLPYELKPYLTAKKSLELVLPDGEKLTGNIFATMPSVDAVSQTQNIVIKVTTTQPIPENLIAKVRISKTSVANTISLPKAAILTDETQSEFWVMKLINTNTAVKVPIQKGIETAEQVEIKAPLFADTDKIIVTGNYGLADTAKVKIIQ